MGALATFGAAAAAILVLAPGCGTATSAGHEESALTARQQAVDLRSCTEVRAALGHISASTAGMLTMYPFDAQISRRLANQARSLGEQGAGSAPAIRSAVRALSTSFTAVSEAMRTGRRDTLDRAVAQSRVAYKSFTRACSGPDHDTSPGDGGS